MVFGIGNFRYKFAAHEPQAHVISFGARCANLISNATMYSPEINSAYGAGVIHSMHLCLSAYISEVPERNLMLWGSFTLTTNESRADF